jgi:hypothetical protein
MLFIFSNKKTRSWKVGVDQEKGWGETKERAKQAFSHVMTCEKMKGKRLNFDSLAVF